MIKITPNLGVPYMGSKRKISHEIIKFILKRHPEADEFYDIFGGGGAMSFIALQIPQYKKVCYNEFNTQVSELVKYLKDLPKDKTLYKLGNVLPDEFYKWINRENFFRNKNRNDYYGGLISSVWSFGNSGKSYMFGKDVEETKRLAHMVCVYKCSDSLKKLNESGISISNKILKLNTIYSRRIFIKKEVDRNKGVSDLQQLQRLQQLEQLQQLERLEVFNLDYKDFDFSKIGKNAIVYLDPPYINTDEYKKGDFNHKELYKWVDKIKAHVYLSSYESPMQVVRIMNHTSIMSGASNQRRVYEKLFYKNGTNA